MVKILKARRTPYIPGHEPKNGDPNMAGDLCADNNVSLTFASSSALLNNSKLRLGSSLMGSAFPSLRLASPAVGAQPRSSRKVIHNSARSSNQLRLQIWLADD